MERLSHKEKGFVKDIVNGETGVQSALNNYDTEDYSTAGAIASENLKKPKIVQAIKTIAERLPDDLLVEKNIALLNKMEMIYTKNEEGQTVRVESDQIDARAVAKGLEIAHRVKGTYTPDSAVNVNIINPVLVRFINKKEDGDTNTAGVQETI